MNKKPVGAIIIIPFLATGGAIPPYQKELHDEPTEPRDNTVTLRSETPYTMNVSYGVSNGTGFRALGLEFPDEK